MSCSPEDQVTAQYLFQILDCVLEWRSCAYVAGPLDSGKVRYECIAAERDYSQVRGANQSRLTAFAVYLRRRLSYPVVDPGLLKISSWSARDHGDFFLEIIRRYAKECWFVDGWEYSVGATKEFVFCCSTGTCRFDERGEDLSVAEGLRLIEQAADFARDLKLDDGKLRSRLYDLTALAKAAEPRHTSCPGEWKSS